MLQVVKVCWGGDKETELGHIESWHFESKKNLQVLLWLLENTKMASSAMLCHGYKYKLWMQTRIKSWICPY